MSKIHVLTPFWPSQNIEPCKIVTVGDWAISQNLFSNLVELSAGEPVRPALAESWCKSPDGLTWTFTLRNGLKWSDGSGIQVDQFVASIRRMLAGTSHTQMSRYVRSIAAIDVCRIKFVLEKLPENFLINLAFADLAIVHPASYENGFSWRAPSSGPYRIEKFADDTISLLANPHFWDPAEWRPKQITMVRAKGDASDIDALLNHNKYNAAQLPPGLIARGDELDALKKKFNIFHGDVDLNYVFLFSKKRVERNDISLEVRRYLLGQTQNSFWNNKEDQTQRSTGLRPPGSKGSLSLKEFDQHLVEFCPLKKPRGLPLSLEVLVADTEVNRPLVKEMIAALESSGIEIFKKVVLKKDFYSEMQIGDFDLSITALGASEPDPDSAWRIFKNDFPTGAVSDEDLNAAQLENDPAKRHMMYQEIERRVLKIAYFIPIKNEYTYILTDRSIEFDLKQAAEWGLQLYKLKLKQLP